MGTKDSASVLVVDDDVSVGKVIEALLRQRGHTATAVRSGELALEALASRPFDVVITDLRMPGMDGMELLARLAETHPDVPVVMISAHGTVPLAVEAMRKGAADFLLKPFDREQLVYVVEKALAQARHAESVGPSPSGPVRGLLGESQPMKECKALITKAAQGMATVLLRGESGTGKELAARALHDASPRKSGPFVKVHCAALPDALLESELFGYEKGAFTGAVARKPGRVELAQGGTLFLDEIGDITAAVQVKLLRLLQDRQYERLGGVETLDADVRFVTATHKDLEAMIRAGEFREDLYYRLSVVPIWLPPLRDRGDDLVFLIKRFVADLGNANGRRDLTIEPAAVERLAREPWPGNVRQLQNFLERLVVLADGSTITKSGVERELGRAPLNEGPRPPPAQKTDSARPTTTLEEQRRTAEKAALEEALQKAAGNRTLAARLLGVSRRTLYNKLEELGIA